MHRIASNEKVQIGTLKALGFKDRRILRHYTSYGLFLGAVGSVIGVALGYLVAWVVVNPDGMMGTFMDMPNWTLYVPWIGWIMVVLTIVLLTLISLLSVKRMLCGTATDALRPYQPKKVRAMKIKGTKLWEKLAFATKWNFRDVMRHKSRSFMTLFGILGCMLLLVGGLGMKDTMGGFISLIDEDVYDYNTKVNIVETADNEAVEAFTESFDAFMEIMNIMVYIFVLAAVVLGIIVLYNLGVMSYVERSGELATLKVLGFKDKQIGKILISQNVWLTVVGVVIGLPSGVGVLYVLIKALASEYELKLIMGPLTYAVSILVTFGVSMVVGLFVARKNKKIDMVEALKDVE